MKNTIALCLLALLLAGCANKGSKEYQAIHVGQCYELVSNTEIWVMVVDKPQHFAGNKEYVLVCWWRNQVILYDEKYLSAQELISPRWRLKP